MIGGAGHGRMEDAIKLAVIMAYALRDSVKL